MKTLFLSLFSGILMLSGCTPTGAYTAIQNGGEWFLNNQDESFLYYKYHPLTKSWPDSHHSTREFGALWSITLLADFLQDSRYDDLAYRGWEHFKETFVYDEASDFMYVNITPEKVKLSYNAFAILVLLNLEDEKKDYYLDKLARGILEHQGEDGEYDTFFFSDRDSGTDYYPGQSILALMSLYEVTDNYSYLESVEKALPFYQNYWDEHANTAFVPWQTQGYYKYYQATGSTEAAEFIFAMNDFMVETYDEGESCSSFKFPGIVMAVYVEGMNKAYMLADELGDADRKRCYKNFIQEGLTDVMSLQFPMEGQNLDDFDLPAWGGFFGSEEDLTMQVDRNQHAVTALMGAYELGLVK